MNDGTPVASEQGFTLAELLVSAAIGVMLLAGLVALANPAGRRARVEPQVIDLQQRVRAGLLSIESVVRRAGAGLHDGAYAGGLTRFFAAVLPRRIGTSGAHAANVARADTLSILSAPADGIASTLAAPFSGTTATLTSGPACRPTAGCGLSVGSAVVIVDRTGQVDLFTVTGALGMDLQLEARGGWSSTIYPAGSGVVEISSRTFYFDPVSRQIRDYDTDASDAPVLDDVGALTFEYFGATGSAAHPTPPLGVANCLYDAAGTRLPTVDLPADDGGLARLPISMFTDGPWCGMGPMRFDADLLRIRRIRVRLTGQLAWAAGRGRGIGFTAAGTSQSAWSWEPDLTMALDVAPPNLELR